MLNSFTVLTSILAAFASCCFKLVIKEAFVVSVNRVEQLASGNVNVTSLG